MALEGAQKPTYRKYAAVPFLVQAPEEGNSLLLMREQL